MPWVARLPCIAHPIDVPLSLHLSPGKFFAFTRNHCTICMTKSSQRPTQDAVSLAKGNNRSHASRELRGPACDTCWSDCLRMGCGRCEVHGEPCLGVVRLQGLPEVDGNVVIRKLALLFASFAYHQWQNVALPPIAPPAIGEASSLRSHLVEELSEFWRHL